MRGGEEPDALLVDQDDQTIVATNRGEVRPLRREGRQPKLISEGGDGVRDVRDADADLANGQRPGSPSLAGTCPSASDLLK